MTSHPLPLQGKVALVTGAGRNIGRAIALTLARDGASVQSMVAPTRPPWTPWSADRRGGRKAVAAMGDVSIAVPPRLADQAAKAFSGVSILVSNAGLRRRTSFLDMSFEEWREICRWRSMAPSCWARYHSADGGQGQGRAFVAISGVSHVGTPNRCYVSASKWGLEV